MDKQEQMEHDAIINSGASIKMLKQLEYIDLRLVDPLAKELLTEIIWSALYAMKNSPDLEIEEAFEMGCEEWDV